MITFVQVRRFLAVVLLSVGLWSCPGKYDNVPDASEKETHAMKERYTALMDEAKKIEPGLGTNLIHHFSSGILSQTTLDDYNKLASKFISEVKSGKFDSVEYAGGKSPGKVRLLLVSLKDKKGAIPFVKGAEGWKIDDIEAAFGSYDKELNIKGAAPADEPSSLASLATLMDPQSSSLDRLQSALDLAVSKDKTTAEKFAGKEKDPWAKTALLYAVWKSGGTCEAFATAYPAKKQLISELYDNDSDSFATLTIGLTSCAASSKKLAPTLKVYKVCYEAEPGPRSVFAGPPDEKSNPPLVDLADAQPLLILKAAVKQSIAYEQDPVANILVGSLHGEKKSKFYQFVTKQARARGKIAAVAKLWTEKMAARDVEEPAGTEEGGTPTDNADNKAGAK